MLGVGRQIIPRYQAFYFQGLFLQKDKKQQKFDKRAQALKANMMRRKERVRQLKSEGNSATGDTGTDDKTQTGSDHESTQQ
jgi:hypothetical protein